MIFPAYIYTWEPQARKHQRIQLSLDLSLVTSVDSLTNNRVLLDELVLISLGYVQIQLVDIIWCYI